MKEFVHEGDYVSSGHGKELNWLTKELKKIFECRTNELRFEQNDFIQIKMLNKNVVWTRSGNPDLIIDEANPKHAETLFEALGVREAMGLSTPIVKPEDNNDNHVDESLLIFCDITRYKSLVARTNYFVAHRPYM